MESKHNKTYDKLMNIKKKTHGMVVMEFDPIGLKSPRLRESCYSGQVIASTNSSATLRMAKNIDKIAKGSFKGNSERPLNGRIGKHYFTYNI